MLPSAFSELFQEVVVESVPKVDDEQPKASSSRTPSPGSNASEPTSSTPFASVLVDVIWAVDVELDSRNELALASDSSALFSDGDSATRIFQGTLDEQTNIAKTRLAKIVCELLVSHFGEKKKISSIMDL